MDIFAFAVEFERENQQYYRECAAKAENEGLRKVFLDLAEEEAKHEEIVKKLAAKQQVKVSSSNILPRAKEVFSQIASQLPDTVLPTEQVHIYKQALELEKRSKRFYHDKASELASDYGQKAFLELAAEEERHQRIMENIVEMVDRPNTWLENAEWYHLEEY